MKKVKIKAATSMVTESLYWFCVSLLNFANRTTDTQCKDTTFLEKFAF